MKDGQLNTSIYIQYQTLLFLLRNNFYAFCRYYDPSFYTHGKPHLKVICDAFQQVTEGKIKKLAISVPPRSGKSYTVSLWCAWMIGKLQDDPNLSIMRNSYGSSLAEKFSYDIREMIQSPKFLQVFPQVKLKQDHKRIEDWAITTGKQSTYFCAGVGGPVTGKGCRTAGILDDSIKNLEDALSEIILDKTWGWTVSTHLSRFESGCPQIHIGTRWSKKDPIGMSIETDKGEGWTQIVIPALDENGNSFCEEIKTTQEYLELKKIMPSFVWEAEFMQNPVETKGLLFPEDELKRFSIKELEKYFDPKQREEFDAVFGYTDTADEGTDFLASGTLAVIGDRYYLIDVIFTQEPIEVTEPMVAQMITATNQIKHTVESNNGGKAFAMKLKELVRNTGSRCHIKWRPNTTNKETRILMHSGVVKQFIWFRDDYEIGSQYDQFMKALTDYVRLGKNKHDDAPDMVTGLAEMFSKTNNIRFLTNESTRK
ncbi:phage terminase large subunit [Immundisolibacter sp.]